MMKISNQTSFVDSSEFGVITPKVIGYELGKLKKLDAVSRNTIKSRFCEKYGLEKHQFSQIIDEPRKLNVAQYLELKEAIQYYSDTKALEKRNAERTT